MLQKYIILNKKHITNMLFFLISKKKRPRMRGLLTVYQLNPTFTLTACRLSPASDST